MSTGMVAIERPPTMAISKAMTTNVYGRRSASLTIHMLHLRTAKVRAMSRSPRRGHVHTLSRPPAGPTIGHTFQIDGPRPGARGGAGAIAGFDCYEAKEKAGVRTQRSALITLEGSR